MGSLPAKGLRIRIVDVFEVMGHRGNIIWGLGCGVVLWCRCWEVGLGVLDVRCSRQELPVADVSSDLTQWKGSTFMGISNISRWE